MSSQAKVLIATTLIAACVAPVLAQSGKPASGDREKILSPFKHESVEITLDPGWFLAKKLRNRDTFILQFLPPGETEKNFDQILNVTTYSGLQTTAKKFMKVSLDKMMSMRRKGASVDYKIIADSDPKDVLYEYSFKGGKSLPDQYEVTRVIMGVDGLHTIINHRPKAEVTPQQRDQMVDMVKRVALKSTAEGTQTR